MNIKMMWFSIRYKCDNLLEKISLIVSSLIFKISIVVSKILSKLISEDILFMSIDWKQSRNMKTIKEMFSMFEPSGVTLGQDKPVDLEMQRKFIEEVDAIKQKTIKNFKHKSNWLK